MDRKPKKNQQAHFPGDPRYGVQEHIIRQDVGALSHGGMLSTRLLTCLIQRAASQPAAMFSDKVLLGSLAVRSYMESCKLQRFVLGSNVLLPCTMTVRTG